MTLSLRLAEHVASARFADLPQSTRDAAALALMDGVSVMLGASSLPEVAPFVELARTHRVGEGGAAVLGHGFRAPAAFAALANGAMAHALDFEDAFDEAPCHPNASLLPAALAIAEAYGPVSGEELVTAIAVGCDLVCRLGLSLGRPLEAGGWYPPPILGAFGAVAAAGKLLRLDARQMLDAFSLMLCQNSCPGEIKHSGETVIRAVREALPAQLAVTCALLAKGGVRGFDAPFEGEAGFYRLFAGGDYDERALLDGLGARFAIDRLTFKRWPCCRAAHAYIEAIQQLRTRRPFAWQEVRSVRVFGGEVQRMLSEPVARKRRPATPIEAKFSVPFIVATILVHGDVALESFAADRLADPALGAVADRVTFVEVPGWERTRMAGGEIELQLSDGAVLRESVAAAQGGPDRPIHRDLLVAKFVDCASRAANPVSPERAHHLVRSLLEIASAPNVAAAFSDL